MCVEVPGKEQFYKSTNNLFKNHVYYVNTLRMHGNDFVSWLSLELRFYNISVIEWWSGELKSPVERQAHLRIQLVIIIVGDPTVTMKHRTAIQPLFFYLILCLTIILDIF